jgi:hypothetical protein
MIQLRGLFPWPITRPMSGSRHGASAGMDRKVFSSSTARNAVGLSAASHDATAPPSDRPNTTSLLVSISLHRVQAQWCFSTSSPSELLASVTQGGDALALQQVVQCCLRVLFDTSLRWLALTLPIAAVRQDEDVALDVLGQVYHVLRAWVNVDSPIESEARRKAPP